MKIKDKAVPVGRHKSRRGNGGKLLPWAVGAQF